MTAGASWPQVEKYLYSKHLAQIKRIEGSAELLSHLRVTLTIRKNSNMEAVELRFN